MCACDGWTSDDSLPEVAGQWYIYTFPGTSIDIHLKYHLLGKLQLRQRQISKMKSSILSLAAIAGSASAHYTFPALTAGSTTTSQWQYVRKTTNYQSNGKFYSHIDPS